MLKINWASQVALVVKNLPANVGDIRDMGSIPGSGRSPGGRCSNPLQYSCLDRGAWQATGPLGLQRVRYNWSDLAHSQRQITNSHCMDWLTTEKDTFTLCNIYHWASLMAQRWRICLPMMEMQETQVLSLAWEDPLGKETATHSSTFA